MPCPQFRPIRCRSAGRCRRGCACRHRAGSSSSAGISRPAPVRTPPRRPALRAGGRPPPGPGQRSGHGGGDAQIGEIHRFQRHQRSSLSSTCTTGAASRLDPMTLAVRCTSSAAVTTRRARRDAVPFLRPAARQASRPAFRACLADGPMTFAGEARQPDILHGEHKDRGQPCGQPVEQNDPAPSARAPAGRRLVAASQ